LGVTGEGIIAHLHGPNRDGIRTSDSRGWESAADFSDGLVELASAKGIKSEGEDLTLETAGILVLRLNANGATWGRPVLLKQHIGRGVDCEARDTQDPGRAPLNIQVTRPKMPEGFWQGMPLGAEVVPGPAKEMARSLWDAIEKKRPAANQSVVLAINAIRTPWLALSPIVEPFRELYGEAASRDGWMAIWVVGAQETFTERLDRALDID
jgi:hypothetical protein